MMRTLLRLLVLGAMLAAGIGTASFALPNFLRPAPEPRKPSELIDETFEGKYRAAVKTSALRDANGDIVIDMEPQTLGKLLDRLDRWDMNDQRMRSLYRWSYVNAPTDRVDEEKHNVRVRGWLKAIKYEAYDPSSSGGEGDNDFHIILSNYRYAHANARFLNIEVSGLPKSAGEDRSMIRETRRQIVDMLNDTNLPSGRYYKPTPPIRVEIEGSLYFDGSHYPGGVGPAGMRPSTVWEIHPVTSIEEVSAP